MHPFRKDQIKRELQRIDRIYVHISDFNFVLFDPSDAKRVSTVNVWFKTTVSPSKSLAQAAKEIIRYEVARCLCYGRTCRITK